MLPSFGVLDLRICSNCNIVDNNISEIGMSYALPEYITKGSIEAMEFLTGLESFNIDEIEVF